MLIFCFLTLDCELQEGRDVCLSCFLVRPKHLEEYAAWCHRLKRATYRVNKSWSVFSISRITFMHMFISYLFFPSPYGCWEGSRALGDGRVDEMLSWLAGSSAGDGHQINDRLCDKNLGFGSWGGKLSKQRPLGGDASCPPSPKRISSRHTVGFSTSNFQMNREWIKGWEKY